jgi:hypothetical protein
MEQWLQLLVEDGCVARVVREEHALSNPAEHHALRALGDGEESYPLHQRRRDVIAPERQARRHGTGRNLDGESRRVAQEQHVGGGVL